MSQGCVKCLGVLPRQQGAHGFDCALHRHGNLAPKFLKRLGDALQARLNVQGILGCLQKEDVRAALDQPGRLFPVRLRQLVESDAPGHRNGLGGRPHGARHEAGLVGHSGGIGQAPGQPGSFPVDVPGLVRQVVLRQHHRGCAEGVGLQDVGPGVKVALVNVGNYVRAGKYQVLVAPFVLRAAEVVRAQPSGLDGGSHCPAR